MHDSTARGLSGLLGGAVQRGVSLRDFFVSVSLVCCPQNVSLFFFPVHIVMPPTRLLFTDIDGTLVHYPHAFDAWGAAAPSAGGGNDPNRESEWVDWTDTETGALHRVLNLPPSSTGKRGTISERTLRLLADAHAQGDVAVVIVSGARSTTLSSRLPCLPPATALAAENGGRLWWHRQDRPTLAQLEEDASWRDAHAAGAGPRANDALAPLHRSGPLWDAYRAFISDGWTPDASGYTTSFRLPHRAGKTEADLDAALARLPPTLTHSRNLGCADVYPVTSGKEAVGAYVAEKLGIGLASAAFLCDDDNDLALASRVGRAFVVSTTHDAVTAALKARPHHYWTTREAATRAADAAVEAALAWLGGSEDWGAAPPAAAERVREPALA